MVLVYLKNWNFLLLFETIVVGPWSALIVNPRGFIMENGSFQTMHLSHLEFESETNQLITSEDISRIPLPNDFNMRRETFVTSNEISSSVETLLNQNEDMMARLKVTLRRLALVENENLEHRREAYELQQTNKTFADQLLIWKEKEKVWKEKNSQLDEENAGLQSQLIHLDDVVNRNLRLSKYYNKVKTQIRPYIKQLKGYSNSLHEHIGHLNKELNLKELEVRKFGEQLAGLKTQVENQIDFYEKNQNVLVIQFEQERERLKDELKTYKELYASVNEKAQALDESIINANYLENKLIALQRIHEDSAKSAQENANNLKQALIAQNEELSTLKMQNQELNSENELLKMKITELETKLFNHYEQLQSTRFLTINKTQENERLLQMNQSLEKLNLELSEKLNQICKK